MSVWQTVGVLAAAIAGGVLLAFLFLIGSLRVIAWILDSIEKEAREKRERR